MTRSTESPDGFLSVTSLLSTTANSSSLGNSDRMANVVATASSENLRAATSVPAGANALSVANAEAVASSFLAERGLAPATVIWVAGPAATNCVTANVRVCSRPAKSPTAATESTSESSVFTSTLSLEVSTSSVHWVVMPRRLRRLYAPRRNGPLTTVGLGTAASLVHPATLMRDAGSQPSGATFSANSYLPSAFLVRSMPSAASMTMATFASMTLTFCTWSVERPSWSVTVMVTSWLSPAASVAAPLTRSEHDAPATRASVGWALAQAPASSKWSWGAMAKV